MPFGNIQDLYERILEAYQKMLEAGQTPNEVIINGRKYGNIAGGSYNPHLFGMALKTEITMPADYDFIIQKTVASNPMYRETYKESPKTNADRIRGMSDEELADWFYKIQYDIVDYQFKPPQLPTMKESWLEWLKKEVEE